MKNIWLAIFTMLQALLGANASLPILASQVPMPCEDRYIEYMSVTTPLETKKSELLHIAGNHRPDLIMMLIKRETPINFQSEFHQSPLSRACFCGDFSSVKLLLEQGADVNNEGGEIPLIQAIRGDLYNSEKIIFLLLEYGANIHKQEGQVQETALHAAVKQYKENDYIFKYKIQIPAIIEILLRNGADITISDAFGKTPLSIAQEKSSTIANKLDCYANKSYDGKLKAQEDYKKLIPLNLGQLSGINEIVSTRCLALTVLSNC